jgi:DNA-binding XRE family transcriptional regulator
MANPQFIRTETGEELVVLARRDYEALLARAGDEAAEDAMSTRIAEEVRAAIASGADVVLPEAVWKDIEAGANPVRALRRFRGMTQQELATAAGLSQSFLSEIEAGRKRGTPDTLKALARVLAVPLDLLA